jgi:hypothetical protein
VSRSSNFHSSAGQETDLEPASIDKPLRKSSRARFPAD